MAASWVCPPWPLDPSCLPPGWDPADLTDDQQAALAMASELLKAATGGWYGQCAVTVRPCKATNAGACTGPCGCAPVCRVGLPGPATGIVAVQIGADVLPPGAVRIDDNRWLVRQDGGPCFPCQRLDLPMGQPGTWSVTYLRGMPVSLGGRRAVTALAARILKECTTGGSCAIDPRTTRLTRQGTTYDLTPQSELGSLWLADPAVSDWLAVANPHQVSAPLTWWTPEMGYVATTVAPATVGQLVLTATADGGRVTATAEGNDGTVWFDWGDGTVTAS